MPPMGEIEISFIDPQGDLCSFGVLRNREPNKRTESDSELDRTGSAGFRAVRKQASREMIFLVSLTLLSAFLLFQVQPVIARYILPWYGGSPAVWTTCLLFFQLGLLFGYGYAYGMVRFLRERRNLQVGIHLSLLAIAVFFLPITPSVELKSDSSITDPVWGIVRLLFFTVGLPYILLSATGPLVQHWFSEIYPDRSPFRLYACSNLGSLLGLLTYPFIVEPILGVSKQTSLWSAGFVAFGFLAILTSCFYLRTVKGNKLSLPNLESPFRSAPDSKPGFSRVVSWIAFSACGSTLLLSLTSQMCQDVAVVPFLWVLPLSLYLVTFIIAFDHARWYFRPLAVPLSVASIGVTIYLMNRQFADDDWPLVWQIGIYCSAVFFSCLICHGEIVRLKPLPRYLTGFYLAISLGGGRSVGFLSTLLLHFYLRDTGSCTFPSFFLLFSLAFGCSSRSLLSRELF